MSKDESFKGEYKFERQNCSFILQICIEYLPDTLSCARDSAGSKAYELLYLVEPGRNLNECSLD